MSNKITRWKRYAKYLFQWIFCEKIRGLDFTMRDKSLIAQTGGVLHGYSKTDEDHARDIFNSLGVDNTKKILDIGCGKGAFLRVAANENFGRVAGVEYVEELAAIARDNFKKLQISESVEVYSGDAIEFDKYSEFNVFYFANPFDKTIMEPVIDKILREKKEEKIWVILYNPVCKDVIESKGGIEVCRLFDKVKAYETIIYEFT